MRPIPFPRLLLPACLLCALSLAAIAAYAQGKVVIYRCTDAAGALTVQNDRPCPKGSQQDKRVIESVRSAPAPGAAVSTPTAAARPVAAVPGASVAAATAITTTAAADAPAIADADRLPPPALFECRTYDKDRYLSDDGTPPQRCAPLTTTGVDGGSDTGAGASCQMVDDQCQRIGDAALCDSWKQRLLEAQSVLRFGRRDNRETAQADVDRVARVVRESTCGR